MPGTPSLQPLQIAEELSKLRKSSKLLIPALDSPPTKPQEGLYSARSQHEPTSSSSSIPLPLMFQPGNERETLHDEKTESSLSFSKKSMERFILQPRKRPANWKTFERSFVSTTDLSRSGSSTKRPRPPSFVSLDCDVRQNHPTGTMIPGVSPRANADAEHKMIRKNGSSLDESTDTTEEICKHVFSIDNECRYEERSFSAARDSSDDRKADEVPGKIPGNDEEDNRCSIIALPRVFRPTIRRTATAAAGKRPGNASFKKTFARSRGSAFSSPGGAERQLWTKVSSM